MLLNLSRVEVVELRDIDREQANSEIVELFCFRRNTLLFGHLRAPILEIDLVLEICRELEAEGAIGLDDNAV